MDKEITRVVGVVSAIGRLARNVTIGTDTFKKASRPPAWRCARVSAEGATGGETTEPKFAELEIEVFPAEVEPWVNNETLEDASSTSRATSPWRPASRSPRRRLASSSPATAWARRAASRLHNVANASYAWGKRRLHRHRRVRRFAASNPGDKLIDLQHALKAQYRPGAASSWRRTLGTVRQMKDGSGNFYLWQPDPLAGFGGRLLGSPVEIDDNMPVDRGELAVHRVRQLQARLHDREPHRHVS
jgi:predicted phage gp36 major capsid-like protein